MSSGRTFLECSRLRADRAAPRRDFRFLFRPLGTLKAAFSKLMFENGQQKGHEPNFLLLPDIRILG